MEHYLKTDPKVFKAAYDGIKLFEIRCNDRHFQVGDFLVLQETKYSAEEMKQGKPLEYTGRTLRHAVNYILNGPIYGLKKGWVIMS